MAAEVVQGTYVFTLIFNFLTFIFSPFFHPASIFPASDLSFFQYRPAHRKLHVVIGDFVKLEPQSLHIRHPISNSQSPCLQTSLASTSVPCCNHHVPARISLRLVARPGSNLWSANVQVSIPVILSKKLIIFEYKLYAKVDNAINVSRNDFRLPP